jgi:pantothenate kinase
MLLLGIVLLIISPIAQNAFADMGAAMKDGTIRKAVVEHPTMNIIAAVLVTIGNAKSKKAIGNGRKFKVSMIFFGLALVLILSRLPFERLF